MKTIFKTVLILFLFLPLSSFAQQDKFGNINTNDLLSSMPDIVAAKAYLDSMSKQAQSTLKSLEDEYSQKTSDYQNNSSTWTDAAKKSKATEIEQLQQRATQYQQDAKDELEKKQDERMTPIINKVKDAIKQVAKEGGYTYIFDTAGGTVLYAVDTEDVTALVKKKLKLK
jgi:outer membrane protein